MDLVKLVLLIALVCLAIFIGPALFVWGLGNVIQGEGYDLNFWSWLGAFAVLFVVGGLGKASS